LPGKDWGGGGKRGKDAAMNTKECSPEKSFSRTWGGKEAVAFRRLEEKIRGPEALRTLKKDMRPQLVCRKKKGGGINLLRSGIENPGTRRKGLWKKNRENLKSGGRSCRSEPAGKPVYHARSDTHFKSAERGLLLGKRRIGKRL